MSCRAGAHLEKLGTAIVPLLKMTTVPVQIHGVLKISSPASKQFNLPFRVIFSSFNALVSLLLAERRASPSYLSQCDKWIEHLESRWYKMMCELKSRI